MPRILRACARPRDARRTDRRVMREGGTSCTRARSTTSWTARCRGRDAVDRGGLRRGSGRPRPDALDRPRAWSVAGVALPSHWSTSTRCSPIPRRSCAGSRPCASADSPWRYGIAESASRATVVLALVEPEVVVVPAEALVASDVRAATTLLSLRAHCERTNSVVLAEGVDSDLHREAALAHGIGFGCGAALHTVEASPILPRRAVGCSVNPPGAHRSTMRPPRPSVSCLPGGNACGAARVCSCP